MEQNIGFCTTSDGIRIAYATVGDGPPRVWVPGWVSHLALGWEDAEVRGDIEYWAARHTIVRYDKRGTGLSDRNMEDYSIDARVRDLEAVVDHLKLPKFAVTGVSEGGPVAIAYAARHPRRVSRLILMGTFAHGAGEGRREAIDAIAQLVEAEWGFGSQTVANLFYPSASPDQVHSFARYERDSASGRDAAAMIRAVKDIDVADLLPKILAPTLVIHGRQDMVIPFALGCELASKIRNARLFPFEGGHGGDANVQLQIRGALDEFLADEQSVKRKTKAPRHVPGSAITVLFTDLEGSTPLTQRLGDDSAQELLRLHNSVVRYALKEHGGTEVKHTGDGIMASFASASRAVESAIAIQQAVASNAPLLRAGIRIRVGLNAGEPILEDDDLFGTAVQLAARICARAEPGEILVSGVVRELTAGKKFLFADSGDAMLRGFEDAVRLYNVNWRQFDTPSEAASD